LQKFKINISSAIINSENADISTMGTDQIVDLFSIDSGDGSGRAEDKKDGSSGKVGAKDAIANLSQLWDEAEYEDLQVDDFLKNLKSRRK
jgi:TATA-binding protein-associated factor